MATGDMLYDAAGNMLLDASGNPILQSADCCFVKLIKCSTGAPSAFTLPKAAIGAHAAEVFKRTADGACYTIGDPTPCAGTDPGAGTWVADCATCEEDPPPEGFCPGVTVPYTPTTGPTECDYDHAGIVVPPPGVPFSAPAEFLFTFSGLTSGCCAHNYPPPQNLEYESFDIPASVINGSHVVSELDNDLGAAYTKRVIIPAEGKVYRHSDTVGNDYHRGDPACTPTTHGGFTTQELPFHQITLEMSVDITGKASARAYIPVGDYGGGHHIDIFWAAFWYCCDQSITGPNIIGGCGIYFHPDPPYLTKDESNVPGVGVLRPMEDGVERAVGAGGNVTVSPV